jgi:hypothetical protein
LDHLLDQRRFAAIERGQASQIEEQAVGAWRVFDADGRAIAAAPFGQFYQCLAIGPGIVALQVECGLECGVRSAECGVGRSKVGFCSTEY